MRWLSSVAILFYLSLLCTPQAFAVHDVRLSPLADSQLYALTPVLPQHLLNAQTDTDDTPPAVLLPAPLVLAQNYSVTVAATAELQLANHFLVNLQARAPPLFSSR